MPSGFQAGSGERAMDVTIPNNEPTTLLDLPPELRNRIYEFAYSSPSEDTISRHVKTRRTRCLPEKALALPLTNRQLHKESLPYYWSCTVFRIEHPGHRELSSLDENLYQWLTTVGKGNTQHIRRLEITVKVPSVMPPKSGATEDPSKAIIDIDLSSPRVEDAIAVRGYYNKFPEFMILPPLRRAFARIPRVEHKPLVSDETLWDLYEACYFISRADPTQRRTWPEFTRAYELNRQKASPKSWSESTYYSMAQELIYGPHWRDILAPKGRRASGLGCR